MMRDTSQSLERNKSEKKSSFQVLNMTHSATSLTKKSSDQLPGNNMRSHNRGQQQQASDVVQSRNKLTELATDQARQRGRSPIVTQLSDK